MEMISEIPKLPCRAVDSHKGSFGKIAIVGGSCGFSGAAALAGRAALRSGAGVVCVAVPATVVSVVASIEPCYTTLSLDADENGAISPATVGAIIGVAERNDVIAFGPGSGTGAGARDGVNALLAKSGVRLVIDADGINCLAKDPTWIGRKKASAILTPHPGEMKRLWLSLFRKEMPSDRVEQAVSMAEKTDCTIVLKGASTVVSDGKKVYVNKTGNAGMATAGSGDVLTGCIAAMAGRLGDLEAAVLGVYVHGLAGDIGAEKIGVESLIATDIIDSLGKAFMKL